MGLFRMLTRSAFICNVCFLLAIFILWMRQSVNIINPGLASLIIVMGFVLSIILNLIVNIWQLIRWVKKKPANGIPLVFKYLNGGFLTIQLILLFY